MPLRNWLGLRRSNASFWSKKGKSLEFSKIKKAIFFLGSRYLLKLVESNKSKVEIEGKYLVLYSKNINDKASLEKQLYAFYRKELRKRLLLMVEVYARQMSIEVPTFKIRYMKTKWGSCATSNQRVWFNMELAKKPLECIEYIVVHELTHLLERHHNKRFILLLDQYFPNWRTQKKLLNELPL
ncbi:M48 family metallopeptidase [Empedobacter falsenii]